VISSNHLNPGAAGQIKAEVKTAGKNGHVVKHVTIYSNDRMNPVLTLSLILDIVKK
jgi:hypothetical protein